MTAAGNTSFNESPSDVIKLCLESFA